MRQKLILFISALLMASFTQAQYNWDFGGTVGSANYLGDIGGEDQPGRSFVYDMKLSQTRPVLGAFARYKLYPTIGLNAGLTWGRIAGADSLTENYAPRYRRNLHFRNDLFELSLRGEYYFYTVNDVGGRGTYQLDFKSFVFLGGAAFYSNPMAKYQGDWVSLRKLKTEGQVNAYSSIQFSIPMGVGLFYTYKRMHRFGWEFGWRMTFTDYLDDVSTDYPDPNDLESDIARALSDRSSEVANDPLVKDMVDEITEGSPRGNPDNNDHYIFTNFTYSYVMRGKSNFYRSRYNYIIGSKRKRRRTRAKF